MSSHELLACTSWNVL